MSQTTEAEILTETRGNLGIITLNRPKAVNALSENMIGELDQALDLFENDDAVTAVVFVGAGERGLCAGGDVVALYDYAKSEPNDAQWFFRNEYQLDHRISVYPKPIIAVMNGLVLGGGVGISAPASHRIATDSTRIGMPETGIGFSPDVGGVYYLAQAPGKLGAYLATTGTHVGGADAVHIGMADYLVEDEKISQLLKDLETVTSADDIDRIIKAAESADKPSALAKDAQWVDEVFAHDDIESIVAELEQRLAADADHPGARALKALKRNSPTGIKTALEAVRRAKDLTLAETLVQDFRTTMNAMQDHDLAEGIRAQLIDKDRNPQWQPATFEEVSAADVERKFGPIPGLDDVVINTAN